MPREKDPELRAELLDERPAAIYVRKIGSAWTWWFPRSQIGYLRKTPVAAAPPAAAYTEVVFTLPEWLVEKENAWDLVTS